MVLFPLAFTDKFSPPVSRKKRYPMASLPIVMLAAACISSPLAPAEEPEESSGPTDAPVPTQQDDNLSVAPATVWLSQGGSRTLSVWVTDDSTQEAQESDFQWTSSDASIVEVDSNGVVHARGEGSATISVETEQSRRDDAVLVTVTSDGQEAKIATILSVPKLEGVWSSLAYSPTYDELFEQHAGEHFDRTGGEWEFTYYDRGLAWYAAWWRTGNAEFLEWAEADVTAYRDEYVLANDGRATPKWVFPEGLAIHHILTGSSASLDAIVKMADHMERAGWLDNMMETRYRDGRVQGRSILVQIIAYELTGDDRFRERATRGIEGLIEWYESSGANGSWDNPTRTDVDYCGGMATFQIAHAILEAMIRYHDLINPDPRIAPIVVESLDYSWDYWVPGEGFAYIQPPESFTGNLFECEGSGTNRPAPDVSLLIATTFGEAYRLTGEERFRARGDEVVEFGLSGATFLSGYKQFNQSFMRSYRYLYFTS